MNFREKIVELLSKETCLKKEEIDQILTIPPKDFGDFAFPTFILAKQQKKDPAIVSNALAASISAPFLEKVEAKGTYVNFFISKESLSKNVLKDIFLGKKLLFSKKQGKVMVEYSSPNTNKPLHLGHLRNNSLGLAISNLLEFTGHKVIKANLINDRGIHICKSILAYKLFGENKTPESEKIKSDHFVGKMYVLFDKMNKEKPELKLEEKAQEMLLKWENGDKEVIALWKKMNDWAIKGMKKTYSDFGTKFDEIFLESKMFKLGNKQELIKEGFEKNVFKKEENGAIIALLEPELPNKVIVRGDGTSLYATNDLVLTQLKFEKFSLNKNIWVVANEQDLYFKQLFKIFEKLGRKWAKKCYHLNYGYVSLTSGRMKSREGTFVDADNLLED
ncbi:MAG: arginine--tRNA ligase, partial [Candidatus ainarchaeum sp.]|nr:arginine--tRNA ligase [Candidatus ainarchaeum sp.]